ncbi:DUF1566 domain-containing protein [Leptospira noguchii]|nr:DUF1566 domain-containing protein [Leptospira noguchii]
MGARQVVSQSTMKFASDSPQFSYVELTLSIIDYNNPVPIVPAIDTTFFPNTPNPSAYWTSTTYDSNKSFALAIAFGNGIVGSSDKSGGMFARCVTTF